MKKLLSAVAVSVMMLAQAAMAKETVVWWDFLSGGDGARMKTLIEKFNAEHADSIEIQATTLESGVPFYTKVQTAAAVGEGQDVMIYHLSRLPLGVSTGTQSEITPERSGFGRAEDRRLRRRKPPSRTGRWHALRRALRYACRCAIL